MSTVATPVDNRKCKRCGGSILESGGTLSCLSCGAEVSNLQARHRFVEDNKAEIIKDLSVLGREATMIKWRIPKSSFHTLCQRWGVAAPRSKRYKKSKVTVVAIAPVPQPQDTVRGELVEPPQPPSEPVARGFSLAPEPQSPVHPEPQPPVHPEPQPPVHPEPVEGQTPPQEVVRSGLPAADSPHEQLQEILQDEVISASRPWTHIIRDTWHKFEGIWIIALIALGAVIGQYLGILIALKALGIFALGYIAGHLFWGKRYIPDQTTDVEGAAWPPKEASEVDSRPAMRERARETARKAERMGRRED